MSEDTQFRTLFSGLEVMFTLTEHGLHHYNRIIAALFTYINIVREAILSFDERLEAFAFYSELKTMSSLGFKYYKVPDAIDNVCDLASELIFTTNVRNILKDVYPDVVLEEGALSKELLLSLVASFSLKNAKIVLSGKRILEKEHLQPKKGLTIRTEPWFKTSYSAIKKDLKHIEKIMKTENYTMKLPIQNPLIPKDFAIKSPPLVGS